jgi:hypothetical protein
VVGCCYCIRVHNGRRDVGAFEVSRGLFANACGGVGRRSACILKGVHSWNTDDDAKLRDVVQQRTHGDIKNCDWDVIDELFPDRTQSQCYLRWRILIDRANERESNTDKWAEEEDMKLVEGCNQNAWCQELGQLARWILGLSCKSRITWGAPIS